MCASRVYKLTKLIRSASGGDQNMFRVVLFALHLNTVWPGELRGAMHTGHLHPVNIKVFKC